MKLYLDVYSWHRATTSRRSTTRRFIEYAWGYTFPVAAEPNASNAGRAASVEKYEPAFKPLRHRRQYVDHRRQKNILLGDVERAERHLVRRLRSGHACVAEGILFGTCNRVYRQPTEGNYRQGVSTWQQTARRYLYFFILVSCADITNERL